jgi:hypothetical protein
VTREQLLKQWIRNWFVYLQEIPEDFEDVKPDLMPIVRSRSHFELNVLRGEVDSGEQLFWPYQVLGEHFGVALAYDLPGGLRSVLQVNLDNWGITFYEAMEIAKENRLHAKNGNDIVAATYSIIESPEGNLYSYAIWAANMSHVLLPKTDAVAFIRSGGESGLVEWEKVVDVAGDLMEAVDIYPPRFRVREFPTEQQLVARGTC